MINLIYFPCQPVTNLISVLFLLSEIYLKGHDDDIGQNYFSNFNVNNASVWHFLLATKFWVSVIELYFTELTTFCYVNKDFVYILNVKGKISVSGLKRMC